MSVLAISKSAVQTRAVHVKSRMRSMHRSLRRQVIMMPAMSPLMTEGTVARWKKKEGDAFAPGDVLLQIESDFAIMDVEAISPGFLSKILTPDGTTNVAIEQVIALVAKDASELAVLQSQSLAPTLPPFALTPTPPSISLSPRYPEFKLPLFSPHTPTMSPRTPSLFELHAMGYGQRSAHVGGPRGTLNSQGLRLDVPPSPSPRVQQEPSTPSTPASTMLVGIPNPIVKTTSTDQHQLDGEAIRRMIVSNLSGYHAGAEFDDFVRCVP